MSSNPTRIERTPEVEAWLQKQLAQPGGQGPIPERARRALAGVLGDSTPNTLAGSRDVPGQPSPGADRARAGTGTRVGAQPVPSPRDGAPTAAVPGPEPIHASPTKAGAA